VPQARQLQRFLFLFSLFYWFIGLQACKNMILFLEEKYIKNRYFFNFVF
jgi:hypothetical protein